MGSTGFAVSRLGRRWGVVVRGAGGWEEGVGIGEELRGGEGWDLGGGGEDGGFDGGGFLAERAGKVAGDTGRSKWHWSAEQWRVQL